MSKIKYTEEIKNKAIELRMQGKSSPEITAETGIKKESLNKLFKERGVKLTDEQAAQARARRWLDHDPIKDGVKVCSKCDNTLPLSEFHNNARRLSGKVPSCKSCYELHYANNSEEIKKRSKRYADSHKEEKRLTDKAYYESHKKERIDRSHQWRKENLERANEIHREYEARNQPAKNARTAMRRANQIQATPKWLSKSQIKAIREMYINCPKGYHVDHIMPLNGEESCGLHVPWNLQYLPALDNLKKSNKV